MTPLEYLRKQPFLTRLSRSIVDDFLMLCEVQSVEDSAWVVRQFHPARHFYLLVSGGVQFFIRIDNDDEALLVGSSSRLWTPLGWSGFFQPHRYATSIRCNQTSVVLKWDRTEIEQLIQRNCQFGVDFFNFALVESTNLLKQGCSFIGHSPYGAMDDPVTEASQSNTSVVSPKRSFVTLLSKSAFFSVFPDPLLQILAAISETQHYERGETLFEQGKHADAIFILERGGVDLSFERSAEATTASEKDAVFLRSRSEPGHLISWGVLIPPGHHLFTAIANRPTTVRLLKHDFLEELFKQHPGYGLQLTRRTLWLTSSYLRAARTRLIGQCFDEEWRSVCSLIEQADPQLSVKSPLRKIPHLLSSRITHIDAFTYLNNLKDTGNTFERNLAGLCIDTLVAVQHESEFYEALTDIYESVVHAPATQSAEALRRRCDAEFVNAFEKVHYTIEGQENLPASPGHIFILNHLVTHPYHALSNNFEFSLDTQFVSAMILYRAYGESAVRVVRKGRGDEHAHQAYYGRLGHIYVYTEQSDSPAEGAEHARARWEKFFEEASQTLSNKKNLVICPEGRSYLPYESPGAFKAGAFCLAAKLDPEPLIVPIVVANFDKRLRETRLTALIKPPFRISEVADVENRKSLGVFLDELRATYKIYIAQAQLISTSKNFSSVA